MKLRRLISLGLVTGLLAACSGYAPGSITAGASQQQVRQRMGEPTGRYPLPGGGTRLEYARGPMGLHTYMVDVDPNGLVTGWQQVLTERSFDAITPGLPVAELLQRLGRPAQKRGGGWQPGQVWSYRFDSPFCLWWQVSVDQGRVVDAAYGPDPRCERNDFLFPRMR